MDYITIVAKFKIIKDMEIVKEELNHLASATRKEKGCVDYIFYYDKDNPLILLLYENWESEKDLEAHMKTDHFINCFKKIEGKFELEVHKLDKLF